MSMAMEKAELIVFLPLITLYIVAAGVILYQMTRAETRNEKGPAIALVCLTVTFIMVSFTFAPTLVDLIAK